MPRASPNPVVDPGRLATREWGEGAPLIVLHPLALESSAFSGLGQRLAGEGVRTVAVDLPGFGRTPAGDEALTPARLAAPVIELARGMRQKPVLAGMSMGGRVALEASLRAPEAFAAGVFVAPYLPRIENPLSLWAAGQLSPRWAERVPLERLWPLLKRVTQLLDSRPELENDWLVRASVRVAYYLSCGATRRALISGARELALDPATGPASVWSRVARLELPTTFVWAGRDALIPASHADRMEALLPAARRIDIPCSGHFVNGRHFRCFLEAMAGAVLHARDDARSRSVPGRPAARSTAAREIAPCLYEHPLEERADAAQPIKLLSGEDAAFVYGETASMPMHTIGTLVLDPSTAVGGFDLERLQRTMASRIHRMPPFRQRLVEVPFSLGRPVLADDPDFRIERHIQGTRVPAPGTMKELADLVASYAEDPLDHTRPLWRMWLVEGLHDGRVALVTKMHHCLMDGASGANQIANLLDLTPETPPLTPPAPWSPPGLPRPAELLRGPYSSGLVHPVALGSAVTATARGMWSRLRVQLEAAFGRESVPSLFDRAPATPFNGAITPHRVAAFASLSLEDVKLVKNTFRVTVNDVVLAACACALRKHLRSRDGLPEGPLVCGCPVSTKSGEEVGEFSNKLSVMTVRLPTDLEAPEDVLEAVHRDAEAAKRALGVVEDDLAGAWFDLVPPGLAGVATRLFSDLGLADWVPAFVNLIISNVAGPPLPLYLAGARVDAIYPMGPIGEGVGLNITVLSNVDRIDIGVLGCRELVPGIDDIAADVVAAVEQLKETAKTRQAA